MSDAWVAAYVGLWLAVLFVAMVQVGVLRRLVSLSDSFEQSRRVDIQGEASGSGLPVGATVPPFEARSLEGLLISSDDLLHTPQLVLFADFDCPPCQRLLLELNDGSPLEVLLTVFAELAPSGAALHPPAWCRLLLQEQGSVSKSFASEITPHAFAVSAEGVILGKDVPGKLSDLQRLAEQLQGVDAVASST